MKYRPPHEWKHGRVYVQASWRQLNLPRAYIYADDHSVTVGFSYGNDGCDPALLVHLELAGTRLGRWLTAISDAVYRVRDRRRVR